MSERYEVVESGDGMALIMDRTEDRAITTGQGHIYVAPTYNVQWVADQMNQGIYRPNYSTDPTTKPEGFDSEGKPLPEVADQHARAHARIADPSSQLGEPAEYADWERELLALPLAGPAVSVQDLMKHEAEDASLQQAIAIGAEIDRAVETTGHLPGHNDNTPPADDKFQVGDFVEFFSSGDQGQIVEMSEHRIWVKLKQREENAMPVSRAYAHEEMRTIPNPNHDLAQATRVGAYKAGVEATDRTLRQVLEMLPADSAWSLAYRARVKIEQVLNMLAAVRDIAEKDNPYL